VFRQTFRCAVLTVIAIVYSCANATAACNFEVIGQGRVAALIDDRTFRLDSGQEIRLGGIEPLGSLRRIEQGATSPSRRDTTALGKLLEDRDVTLRGPTAKSDRYGRLIALVYVGASTDPVQSTLLEAGEAVSAGNIGGSDDKNCTNDLLAREASARRAKKGFWSEPAAIKNTERVDDISPWIGRFVVAEGKIASVREAGGIVYVNFGRRWTQDFAVTIPRRMIKAFEAAGIAPKTLENKIVRVRGWVEQRGSSPRIEALGPGQIELMGDR
jgi:endonuclease YncB( thermonuclease family)